VTTSSKLSNILVDGDLPDDVLLGRLVLFKISIPSHLTLTRDDLEKRFVAAGLNTALLPPEIKPSDAFKKATSEAKDSYLLPDGTTAEVLCRDVAATKEYIRRQITREVRDTAKVQLRYARAITCTFWRPKTEKGKPVYGSERMQLQIDRADLDPVEFAEMDKVRNEIERRYFHYAKGLDSNRVRHTVRQYLLHLNAIEIKGGVYFIHVSKSAELAALQATINALGECEMNTIPLVDLQREREFVTRAYEREASEALITLAKEARDLMANRKSISPAAYAKIKDAYDAQVASAQEHMVTLKVSQDSTGAAAQVALDALSELQLQMLKG
jgi:hypothetical protein